MAALDALVEIRDAVGPEAIAADGRRHPPRRRRGQGDGARRGRGAIGRLYAYGLAVGGADGVEAVIRQLLAEVDLTLALCGGTAIADLDRSLVAG